MRFNTYSKTDTYYEFLGDDGYKMIIPTTDVVLINDESGVLTIKNTATRCIIGYVPKN